jgi:hypothetical protein
MTFHLTSNIHLLSTILGEIQGKVIPIILDSGSIISLLNPDYLTENIVILTLGIPIVLVGIGKSKVCIHKITTRQ